MIQYDFLSLKWVMVLILGGCSSLPETIATGGSHLGLLNKITLDRQRHFTLSSASHLGLAIVSASQAGVLETNSINVTIDKGVMQVSRRVLAQSFKQVSLVSKEQPAKGSVDFLVQVHVLHAEDQTKANNEVKYTAKARKFKGRETTTKTRKRIVPKPHRAILKLNLFDARTGKVLDVALIKSRSGAFMHTDFEQFLHDSLRLYAHSMVSTTQASSY